MRVKFPRTMHLPFSEGVQSDDKVISTLEFLKGKEVVITEKMDGENTTMYCDGTHARSIDSRHHPSRDWLKRFHAGIAHLIPDGYRVCGENLYAKHSVAYSSLKSYFYGFSVWDEANTALSWDDTLMWFDELSIEPVPVLYRGVFDVDVIKGIAASIDTTMQEGFVVRYAGEILYDEYQCLVAKWVRKGHVQTDTHWMQQEVVPNQLGV